LHSDINLVINFSKLQFYSLFSKKLKTITVTTSKKLKLSILAAPNQLLTALLYIKKIHDKLYSEEIF